MRLLFGRQREPATMVGRWLEASFLRQDERRERIYEQMGALGWNSEDTLAVVRCAFAIAVKRVLPGSDAGRTLEQVLRGLEQTFGDEAPEPRIVLTEIDRVLAGDISPSQEFDAPTEPRVYSLVAFYIVQALRMPPRAVTELVIDAERWAHRLGWNPMPASS
jgi:hypothetical protein